MIFPFCIKPVLGCFLGISILDKYERFEEEHVLLAVRQLLPYVNIVKGSMYSHVLLGDNIKMLYVEFEKKDGSCFSLSERTALKRSLEEKLKSSVEKLIPAIFMVRNEEEVLRNILILYREIHSSNDIPQVMISFDRQMPLEIVFTVIIVSIGKKSPHEYFEKNYPQVLCFSERTQTVEYLHKEDPIEAHVLRIHIPKEPSILRTDSSFNFYLARKKVAELLHEAIGEFRDYNGGIILKQAESLTAFKKHYNKIVKEDPDLIENFFYSITPIELQATISIKILIQLFDLFLEMLQNKDSCYSACEIRIKHQEQQTYICIRATEGSFKEFIRSALDPFLLSRSLTSSQLNVSEILFLNYIFTNSDPHTHKQFLEIIQKACSSWKDKIEKLKVLKLFLQFPLVSLDPRLGGDDFGSNILRLLFEGLTRINRFGKIEYAIAESVVISPDHKHYTFKLRQAFWNNHSPVMAYDFEYAWKKILSPTSKTPFAYFFYPIKNAKLAKQGFISIDDVGIKAVDERTLEVTLDFPAPYFLELTAHILFSPINHSTDQLQPNWPFQTQEAYACNGAFCLKVNSPQGYTLMKNPLYWDIKNITIDRIVILKTPSYHAYELFQDEKIDWIGNPFGPWDPMFKIKKNEKLIIQKRVGTYWYVFNTQKFPFSHSKLRQAFALAINLEELVNDLSHLVEPAYSPLLFSHSQLSFDSMQDRGSLQKACKLFDEALFELGLTRQTFPSVALNYLPGGFRDEAAKGLKLQWERAFSIRCHTEPLDWDLLFPKMTQGNFQIGGILWTSPIDDPIYTLNAFRFKNEGINFSKWENKGYQQLLNLADYETDHEIRFSYLAKAEQILLKEIPVFPAFHTESRSILKDHLQVLSYKTPSSTLDLKWICFDEKSF